MHASSWKNNNEPKKIFQKLVTSSHYLQKIWTKTTMMTCHNFHNIQNNEDDAFMHQELETTTMNLSNSFKSCFLPTICSSRCAQNNINGMPQFLLKTNNQDHACMHASRLKSGKNNNVTQNKSLKSCFLPTKFATDLHKNNNKIPHFLQGTLRIDHGCMHAYIKGWENKQKCSMSILCVQAPCLFGFWARTSRRGPPHLPSSSSICCTLLAFFLP
jgi:hypothetical protein